MLSSKVKWKILDANSSWKLIFDNESFEFQVKLNTAVFWSKVKCKKLLQKRCIPQSVKENSLCMRETSQTLMRSPLTDVRSCRSNCFKFKLKCYITQLNMQITMDSPLFLLDTGKILTRRNMNNRFEQLLQQMQLQPKDFKVYSLWIGGATSMACRGVDHRVIQIAGRWKKDCYRVYIRMTPAMIAQRQKVFSF